MRPGLRGIGYEGLSIGAFVGQLRAEGITIVADVRLTPLSRKPGFSKRALAIALGRCLEVDEHSKPLRSIVRLLRFRLRAEDTEQRRLDHTPSPGSVIVDQRERLPGSPADRVPQRADREHGEPGYGRAPRERDREHEAPDEPERRQRGTETVAPERQR
jgi:Protein of unknown function, DUF488